MGRPKQDITKQIAIVAKDLLESNQDIADVGIILGCLGNDSMKSLEELKAECTDINEFIERAGQWADVALIAACAKEAMGYKYKEVEQNWIKVPSGYDSLQQPIMKDMPGNKKVRTKVARPNDQLLKFLLKCRLPEYFTETQRIEINKKVIEIKENTRAEIESFGRGLLQAIDADFEPKKS